MAEVLTIEVPDIGDFDDVPVVEVYVSKGDTVAQEDPLVALESDKATMDVPSPAAGTVTEVLVKVDDEVSKGTPIVKLEQVAGEPKVEESGNESEQKTELAEDQEPGPEQKPQGEEKPAAKADGDPVYASPSVRRLAREKHLDLSTIEGSGRKGRITKEDLEGDAVSAHASAPAAGSEEHVKLSRIKKISGPRLVEAWQTIPHVTHNEQADVTDLETFRKQVNSEQDHAKVTMVALLMKAVAAGLEEFPEFNASLDGDELILKRYYNVGFATDTPNGLLVPVIRNADSKGLLDVATELAELSGRAREGKLKSEEMQGGTFTISSLGGIGGTGFTPIINPPQVAILGVTRSATKPVWDGTEFVPRLIVPLSLSYDHRVLDGAAAARFCAHLARVLSDLRRVLL